MHSLSPNSDSPSNIDRHPATFWVHTLLIATVTGSLLWSTWLTWPDAIVDFGRELYVPWQILEGKVLYRDLALFNGPLSPYLNAFWMALLGVSFRTLVIFNFAIIVLVVILIYRMVSEALDSTAALLASLTFVALFAFNQYTVFGNHNWLAPYSHEMTHGIALTLLALFCLKRLLERLSPRYALLSGIFLGLTLLTKVEIAAAAGVAIGGGFVLGMTSFRDKGMGHKLPAFFLLGFLLPPLASGMLISTAMPIEAALVGTAGSSFHVFNSHHSNLPYFAAGMGILNFRENFASLLRWSMAYAIVLIPPGFLALKWNRGKSARRPLLALLGFELLCGIWFSLPHFRRFADAPMGFSLLAGLTSAVHLKQFARPWPLLLLIVLVIALVRMRQAWRQPIQRSSAIFKVSAVGFALLLLLKILLNTRIGHYGFGLAMPAAVVLVAVCGGSVPHWISANSGCGRLFRSAFVVVWVVVVTLHVGVSTVRLSTKMERVGFGPDAFVADARGRVINEMINFILEEVEPHQTLTALPDGEMLSYLSRRDNPSRFGQFNPATLLLFGEQNMLDDLRAAAPDFIAIVHNDASNFGLRSFGRDYATTIYKWIQETYEPTHLAGSSPFQEGTQFGVLLLRRRSLSTSTGSSSSTQSLQ